MVEFASVAKTGVGVFLGWIVLFAAGIFAALVIPSMVIILYQIAPVFNVIDMVRLLSFVVMGYFFMLTIIPAVIVTVGSIVGVALLGPFMAPMLSAIWNNIVGGLVELLGAEWTFIDFNAISISDLQALMTATFNGYASFLMAFQNLMLAIAQST